MVLRRFPEYGRRLATIDPRSAGMFRITLAGALIVQAVGRASVWTELCGADGVVPASFLVDSQEIPYCPTILTALEQTSWGVPAFFAFAYGVYGLLLIGWRTRLMTALSLFAFSSIAHRNPYLMIGADAVLGSMLLWAQLLPLGDRFSLDSRYRRRTGAQEPASQASLAQFGAIAQIAVIYLATAWLKQGPSWWDNGTALTRVLGFANFRNGQAGWLESADPHTLAFLTRLTLALEWALPAAILSPWRQAGCRRAAIAGMAGLHLSILCVLNTGLFPVVMLSLTPLLMTADDWRILGGIVQGRSKLSASTAQAKPNAAAGSGSILVRWPAQLVAGALLLGLAVDNLNRNFLSRHRIAEPALLAPWTFAAAPQRWEMFAPDVPACDSVIRVELLTRRGDRQVVWSCPDAAPGCEGREGFLWRLLMVRITGMQGEARRDEGERLRAALARYFLRDARRRGEATAEEIAAVEVWLALRATDRRDAADWQAPEVCVVRMERPTSLAAGTTRSNQ